MAYASAIRPDYTAVLGALDGITPAEIGASNSFAAALAAPLNALQNLQDELDALPVPADLAVSAASLKASTAGLVRGVQESTEAADDGSIPLAEGIDALNSNATQFGAAAHVIFSAAGITIMLPALSLSTTSIGASRPVPSAVESAEPVAAGRSGCPSGTTVSSRAIEGYTYRLVEANQFAFWLCVTTPGGATTQIADVAAADVMPFTGSNYFEVDGLGHVFVNYPPGNVAGVAVVIPGSTVKFIEVTGASVVDSEPSFKLDVATDNCQPTCASGTTTHVVEVWDATLDTYVKE